MGLHKKVYLSGVTVNKLLLAEGDELAGVQGICSLH